MSTLLRRHLPSLAAAVLLTLSSAAALAQAKLVPAGSELAFTSRQMGVPVDGHFKRFDAQLAFDPKKPEAGKVALVTKHGRPVILALPFDDKLLDQGIRVSPAVKLFDDEASSRIAGR